MARTLRIGYYTNGLIAGKPSTGLHRYQANLLKHVAALAEPENLTLYLYFMDPIPPRAFAPEAPLGQVVSLAGKKRVKIRVAPMQRGWLRFGMGLVMRWDRLDVFHFTGPQMSGYCPVPAVVTVHDLAALSAQADVVEKERRYLDEALSAIRRASGLIAVSESARREIIQHTGRTDVDVSLEGVDVKVFKQASAAAIATVKQKYSLDRYVLCVGTLQARKNHLRLIQAFERLQGELPHDLVLAGGDGSGSAEIRAYLASIPNPRIKLLGYVEEEHLPALYSGAEALALPSLWEGFGLPIIEAMACGTPIVTSNVSSLVEVSGEAAELVDPKDVEDIARGLRLVLTDQARREQLIGLGFERTGKFSWADAARHAVARYRAVAKRR